MYQTKIIEHKCCACGYEFCEEVTCSNSPYELRGEDTRKSIKGDEGFIGVIFDRQNILYGGRGRSFDAFACPKCKTLKLA